MKNSTNLFLMTILLISSCMNYEIYEEPAKIIMKNYGGELAYGVEFGVGTQAKSSHLSIELNNSLFLQYGISPNYVMTHIATEFAKFTPENIQEIQVDLSSVSPNNEIKNFSKKISIRELKLIISKEKILHECFDKIALKNITELEPLLSNEYQLSFIENNGEGAIQNINEIIGEYKGSMFRGYELIKDDVIPNKEFILLNGLMLGTNQNIDISIIIDPEKDNNKSIVGLDIIIIE